MMDRRSLQFLFGTILVTMVAVTIWASLEISILDAWGDYRKNPWAIATLVDAYFGFITFFVWVAWRERSNVARSVWFVLIMCLGNMAMAAYVLIQLAGLPEGAGAGRVFERKSA